MQCVFPRAVVAVAGWLAAATTLDTAPVGACSCVPNSRTEQIAAATDVFLAQVAAVPTPTPSPSAAAAGSGAAVGPDTVLKGFILEVSELLKRSAQGRVEVFTPSDAAACGVPFEIGEAYLVFARRTELGLQTDLCRGNVSGASLESAADEVRRSGDSPQRTEPTPPRP